MSGPFVAALKAEIANLEAELSENKIYRRLGEAKRLLALYADEPDVAPGRSTLAQLFVTQAIKKETARRSSPERAKALDAARMFLANRTDEPTPTAIIYDHVTSLGIEIGGNDPRNNLSAMLSNSPIFQSHGRAGWTLASAKGADEDPRDPDLAHDLARESEEEDAPPPPPDVFR